MKMFHDGFTRQQMVDPGIRLGNFNRMMGRLEELGGLDFNPNDFDVIVMPGVGIAVSLHSRTQTEWMAKRLSFGYSQLSAATIRINAGTIRKTSGNIAVAETDVTLTGTPAWVVVQWIRSSGSTTVECINTEPVVDAVMVQYPILKLTADYGVYHLDQLLHMGDIVLDSPAA